MNLENEFINYHRNMNYTLNKNILYKNSFYNKQMKKINSLFECSSIFDDHCSHIGCEQLVTDFGQYENNLSKTACENEYITYKTFDSLPHYDSINKTYIDKDIINKIITKLLINYNNNIDNNIKYYHSCIFTELSLEVNNSYHDDTFLLALVIANDLRQLDVINIDDRLFNYYLDKFVEKISNIYTNTYTYWVYNLFNSQQIVTNMKYTLGLDNLYFAQYIGAIQKYISKIECPHSPSIELIYGVICNHSHDEFLKPFINYSVDELVTTTDLINNFREDFVKTITKKFFNDYFQNDISINNTINTLMIPYFNLLTYRTYKTFCYEDVHHININYIISNYTTWNMFRFLYENIENFSKTFSIILELVTNEFQLFSNNTINDTQLYNKTFYHFITYSYISNMNMIIDSYIFYINNIAYHYNDFNYEYYFNVIPWKKIASIDYNIIYYTQYHFRTYNIDHYLPELNIKENEYYNNVIINPYLSNFKTTFDPGYEKYTGVVGVITTLFNYYSIKRMEKTIPKNIFDIVKNNLHKLSNYQKLIK
ncbi:hypothetical protein PBI_SCTP2_475 [Salicola phage SCTP-2]|nr:hypothetical protein PBI_SCTP2_475 [Salicola phage SCTP-2]